MKIQLWGFCGIISRVVVYSLDQQECFGEMDGYVIIDVWNHERLHVDKNSWLLVRFITFKFSKEKCLVFLYLGLTSSVFGTALENRLHAFTLVLDLIKTTRLQESQGEER